MREILNYTWRYKRGEYQVYVFNVPLSVEVTPLGELILKKTFNSVDDANKYIGILREHGIESIEQDQGNNRKIILHETDVLRLIRDGVLNINDIMGILYRKFTRTKNRSRYYAIRRVINRLSELF